MLLFIEAVVVAVHAIVIVVVVVLIIIVVRQQCSHVLKFTGSASPGGLNHSVRSSQSTLHRLRLAQFRLKNG